MISVAPGYDRPRADPNHAAPYRSLHFARMMVFPFAIFHSALWSCAALYFAAA